MQIFLQQTLACVLARPDSTQWYCLSAGLGMTFARHVLGVQQQASCLTDVVAAATVCPSKPGALAGLGKRLSLIILSSDLPSTDKSMFTSGQVGAFGKANNAKRLVNPAGESFKQDGCTLSTWCCSLLP